MESISHPEQLAFELYSQDMISIKLCDETMKMKGPSTYCRTSRLVVAVKDQIMVNPSVLHKFLSVVRKDPSLVYIADAMSDSYRKCIARSVCCITICVAMTWNSFVNMKCQILYTVLIIG